MDALTSVERHCIVEEFQNEHLTRMLPLIADELGFRPERHRVELYGTCRACLRGGAPARP